MEEKELLKIIEEAARDERKELYLAHSGIKSLPAEIGKLTNLTKIYLFNNQLASIPKELGQLTNLTTLYLYRNEITIVPKELGQLKNLTRLDLEFNQLTSVPKELGQLKNLTELYMYENQITSVPKELGRLKNLTELYLYENQLTSFSKELGRLTNLKELYLHNNQLTSVPKELGQLTNLTRLYLDNNQLTSVPKELGQLTNLEWLNLYGNQLTSVPKELGQLTNLERLNLYGNQLTSVPKELGQLTNLRELYLYGNQLTSVPKELGQLTNLTTLRLDGNQLMSVPKELGQLTNLTTLRLDGNQLTSVPKELGQLTELEHINIDDNPLMSPPPEVVRQGMEAILAFLRERLKESKKQWVSKMILVGEGGVGKTQLLRSLQGKDFQIESETTHGIGIEELKLNHPEEDGIEMTLNCWDFGGQDIYHATHQFFLTKRSLFVLVWDARQGWEAGKLYKWLDAIEARAPGAPILIVASKIDERDADLPLDDLLRRYDSVIWHYEVSNKTKDGVEALRESIVDVAAGLPLMGEEWPASWLKAADAIRKRTEQYISPKKFYRIMNRHEIRKEDRGILAQWLHDLGDILYFREVEELNDLVILDPGWVNEKISRVLESREVIGKYGIFRREHMDELWEDVEEEDIRQHLLRLMEQFDLSYRTLENREISLVVERLPLDPPNYRQIWDSILETKGWKEISMKFMVGSLQAGLPTWFIARSHRFTTHTHWRMGALFADGEEEQHLGLIETYPHERQLQLTVRGPAPHNFFTIMRDGLELTLARFPGLKIKRTIPCTGHDEGGCPYEFDFEQLRKAIEREKPVLEVQCQETFENVSVAGLMFGLHWRTQDAVIMRIDEMEDKVDEMEDKVVGGQELIITELRELRGLTQREFLRLFNAQQEIEESHCPNVFAVLPKDGRRWLKNLLGQKMVLQLYCQEPGQWHPAVEGAKGGRYEIKMPGEFLGNMGPYILKLAKVIKYAAPVAGAVTGAYAGPLGAVMGAKYAKDLAGQIKLMEELAKKLVGRDYIEAELLERTRVGGKAERIEGMELRMFRQLLDEVDEHHEWGGLKKVLTPEGHYLWLCEEHAEKYRK